MLYLQDLSAWGRQQEIKRRNVLFKAYFYAFFLFSISLPFQKPFSALVIQPGRGFLSFPHPPFCTNASTGLPPRKSGRGCPQGASVACKRLHGFPPTAAVMWSPAWSFRSARACDCVHLTRHGYLPHGGWPLPPCPGRRKPWTYKSLIIFLYSI